MRVDGNAATVVADAHEALVVQFQLDAVSLAGDGLVHSIVQDLGRQVMHGSLVGAPDIHAGAPADGLQPLQNLDVLGGVVGGFLAWGGGKQVVHGAGL